MTLLWVAPPGAVADSSGVAEKKPVLAGSCITCPWGEIAEFVKEAMKPEGYDVQICFNCNRVDSPRFVAEGLSPPPLTPVDAAEGTTTRPLGPVDFGVTDALRAKWAYDALYDYKDDKPHRNLRLVALIEDPVYFIIAVKANSGITDLRQIAEKRMPVRIMTEGGPLIDPILDYYGLTKKNLESWGGRFAFIMAREKPDFDVMISAIGSLANNPESNAWYEMSQKYDLRYLELAPDLRAKMATEFGLSNVELPLGYLRGVTRAIPSLGRSGDAILVRDDAPNGFAYDVAKAVDQYRERLKWFDRPYSYDSRTVWQDFDVPLHPGAARYYREAGYRHQEGQKPDVGSTE